jgi:hypothetical protein
MKRGKCELCRAVTDLHDSHYLPKSGYKKTRATKLKNPNPVVLSGGKAKTKLTAGPELQILWDLRGAVQ